MQLPNLTEDIDAEDIDIESLDDVEFLLDQLGTLETEIDKKSAEMDTEIAKINRRLGPVIQRRKERAKEIEQAIIWYAKRNRDEVLRGTDGKTLKLVHGTISFAKGRKRLVYTDDKEAIIERLREVGEGDLIVMQEKLHKKPLMKAWPRLEGRVEGLEMKEGEEKVRVKARAA